MANKEYITDNKLTLEADRQKRFKRKFILFIGGICVIGALRIHFYVALFVLLVALLFWLTENGSEIIRSGAYGEDYAIKILMQLPESFTLFNQVDIPNAQSRTKVNEADIIVVGPNAIFIIEVKHNKGEISGSEKDKEWDVCKGRYEKTMRNPMSQVKKLVWLLSDYLKKTNTRAWIQGIVWFTNDEAEISVSQSPSIPVFQSSQEIVSYILNYQATERKTNVNNVLKKIAELKKT